jgi:hypothetical protein
MPLIQPEKKVSNESLTVTLPSDCIQEIRAYAKFLDSSVAYVLTQLIATLGRDKEFQQWKTHHPVAVLASPRDAHKNGASKLKE